MTPHEYCRDKVARHGADLYYSILFTPSHKRRPVIAVHALFQELHDAVRRSSDPGVSQIKIDWWREEVCRAYSGQPRHPVGKALTPHLDRHRLDQATVHRVIDGLALGLTRQRYDTMEELVRHCRETGALQMQLWGQINGYSNPSTWAYAANLGVSLQLMEIIRNVRADARRHRIYLPTQGLHQFGVSRDSIIGAEHTRGLVALLTEIGSMAKRYHDMALVQIAAGDRTAQIPCTIMGALRRALLAETESDGYRVIDHGLQLTALRKLWIAFLTWQRQIATSKLSVR